MSKNETGKKNANNTAEDINSDSLENVTGTIDVGGETAGKSASSGWIKNKLGADRNHRTSRNQRT